MTRRETILGLLVTLLFIVALGLVAATIISEREGRKVKSPGSVVFDGYVLDQRVVVRRIEIEGKPYLISSRGGICPAPEDGKTP